jgi:hypothetical protein
MKYICVRASRLHSLSICILILMNHEGMSFMTFVWRLLYLRGNNTSENEGPWPLTIVLSCSWFTTFENKHYRNHVLCWQRTLGKYFIDKGFFAEYFFRTCRVFEKHSTKKNTRQIKNRKNKKNSKTFF